MSALAGQADSQVWMTAIRFNSQTDSITLKGGTFKPEQIPLLLKRLQNTSVFKGRHFAKLLIQQSKETPEQVDFSVSSSLKPETEDTDARNIEQFWLRFNQLSQREKIMVAGTFLLIFWGVWDNLFYQPLQKENRTCRIEISSLATIN